MEVPSRQAQVEAEPSPLAPVVRLLLWDYSRGSRAYDLALLLVVLVVLLVPGAFWGDPLWPR
jgi:hypothetical protein